MNTCEIRNNKLYILTFGEHAKWLITKTRDTVLFCNYKMPAIKVTPENFDWCNARYQESRNKHVSGNDFIIEIELPMHSLRMTSDSRGFILNSYQPLSFSAYDFSDLKTWRSKRIEEMVEEAGSWLKSDQFIEEVDNFIKTLPINED